MDNFSSPRRRSDFVAMDLGIKAAKVLCDRFGAQIVDYSSDNSKGSITLRLPSRRERFAASRERYEVAVTGASEIRRQNAELLASAEENRVKNRALRTSLAELRRSMHAARRESQTIVGSFREGTDDPRPSD